MYFTLEDAVVSLDAGVPGSNLFRGCCFLLHILLGPKGTGCIISAYCKFGSFRNVLFSRNFSHAKFRENKIIVKWRNNSVVNLPWSQILTLQICLLTLIFACISEFTVACVVTEVFIYVPYTC